MGAASAIVFSCKYWSGAPYARRKSRGPSRPLLIGPGVAPIFFPRDGPGSALSVLVGLFSENVGRLLGAVVTWRGGSPSMWHTPNRARASRPPGGPVATPGLAQALHLAWHGVSNLRTRPRLACLCRAASVPKYSARTRGVTGKLRMLSNSVRSRTALAVLWRRGPAGHELSEQPRWPSPSCSFRHLPPGACRLSLLSPCFEAVAMAGNALLEGFGGLQDGAVVESGPREARARPWPYAWSRDLTGCQWFPATSWIASARESRHRTWSDANLGWNACTLNLVRFIHWPPGAVSLHCQSIWMNHASYL